MPNKSLDFSETPEEDVLSHVSQYRMTVHEAVTKIIVGPHGSSKVARKLLNRLVKQGSLGVTALYRNRRYFYLTKQGANRIDSCAVTPHHGPLSEPAKLRAYAMLAYCCLQDKLRDGLSRVEFQRHFPDLYRSGLAMNYYVDTNGDRPRLGFLRVDSGGRGRWDRVVAKVRRDVGVHYSSGGFRRLIRDRTFEIAVVTALPQKANRIRQALADKPKAAPFDVHVVAMPDLLHLVLPPPIPAHSNG